MTIHRPLALAITTAISLLLLNAFNPADAALLVVDGNSYGFNGPNGPKVSYIDQESLGYPPIEVSENVTGYSLNGYLLGSNLGNLAYSTYVRATPVGDNMIASEWSEGTRFDVTGRPVNSQYSPGTHVPLQATFNLGLFGHDQALDSYIIQEFRNFANLAWEITVAPGDFVIASTSTSFLPDYPPYTYPHLSSAQITYSTPGTYVFTYEGDYTYLANYLDLEIKHQSWFQIWRGVGAAWGDTPSSVRLLYGGVATTSDLSIGPDYFVPENVVPEPSSWVLLGSGLVSCLACRRLSRGQFRSKKTE